MLYYRGVYAIRFISRFATTSAHVTSVPKWISLIAFPGDLFSFKRLKLPADGDVTLPPATAGGCASCRCVQSPASRVLQHQPYVSDRRTVTCPSIAL